jgi:RNA polymerase sigma-70 factor, ECF subfamily
VLLLVTDADPDARAPILDEDDRRTVAALLAGDERAFEALVRRYHSSLLRVAMSYVRPRSAAEEVVQETWLGVLRGLPTFEGRSSLRTWIFRILVNQARTRGVRERRTVPFSALGEGDPAVDPERFLPDGRWATPPAAIAGLPEAALLGEDARAHILAAIDELPPTQRDVITLRDVEGFTAADVREALGLTQGNERVLLHRARARVRARLEPYFDEAAA